jgi:hypothetical protein
LLLASFFNEKKKELLVVSGTGPTLAYSYGLLPRAGLDAKNFVK